MDPGTQAGNFSMLTKQFMSLVMLKTKSPKWFIKKKSKPLQKIICDPERIQQTAQNSYLKEQMQVRKKQLVMAS